MEETFEGQGLEVLGFVSNDFGNQGGDDEDLEACKNKYMVTFDEFSIDHVIDTDGGGPETPQPVFAWIAAQANPGPAPGNAPTWNFHKWLVARDGTLVNHFPQGMYPGDDPGDPNDSFESNPIVVAIEAELAK